MEYNSYLQNCGNDDVLSFDDAMFKVGKFKDAVEYAFTDPRYLQESFYYALQEKKVATLSSRQLLVEGLDGEILKIGVKGWQKGKLRIRVTV